MLQKKDTPRNARGPQQTDSGEKNIAHPERKKEGVGRATSESDNVRIA
jgi:hypothetical protein